MRIMTEDKKQSVDIGGEDIWKAVYSTALSCIGKKRKKYQLAFDFLETGRCKWEDGYSVARQINLVRDELSQFSPDKAVYDLDNPKEVAPWNGRLSPVITSCANMFTTSDGKDLLYEIVKILSYAQVARSNVGKDLFS